MQLALMPKDDPPRVRLGESNESRLAEYRVARLAEGAAPRTVDAEVGQLRSLVRDSLRIGGPATLNDIIDAPAHAGLLLVEPGTTVGRSTMLTRLRALQRLMMLGVSRAVAEERLHALDASLGARPSNEWHEAGVLVGGRRQRASQRTTLPPSALESILDAAADESIEAGALAGLLCFSAVPIDRVCALRWDDLRWGAGALTCEVAVDVGGNERRFFVLAPGVAAMLRLYVDSAERSADSVLFEGRTPGKPVTDRAVRARLARWGRTAGWPGARRQDLVSALAAWLSDRGIDDHSIKVALGRRRVKSVDALLEPHRRLDAQLQTQRALAEELRSGRGGGAREPGRV